MTDIVLVLKAHARILQKDIEKADRNALFRARRLGELSQLQDIKISGKIKRRHCLAILAQELGFNGWPHLLQVMKGRYPCDYGTFFYPKRCRVHYNIWLASYEEAARIREEHGGFLLAYRSQYIIVDEHYIRSYGLDPNDQDWHKTGRDWVKPEMREMLYGKLVMANLGQGI